MERFNEKNIDSIGPLSTDRWLEIDLYWFKLNDISGSVKEFWDRYHPLFRNVGGIRGIILCIGWLISYIADWHGDLGDLIPLLPSREVIFPWRNFQGTFHGSMEERKQQYQELFKKAAKVKIQYQPWTYKDLKSLINEIQTIAREKYEIDNLVVGSLIVGYPDTTLKSNWVNRHPEAFLFKGKNKGHFNPGAILKKDCTPYGAFPAGIPTGLPMYKFLGQQWGSLSKATGLGALILRDGLFGQYEYAVRGPFGTRASSNPAEVKQWNEWTSNLVRECKQSNPQCLIIGYSTAASAIADWRVDCFDLESIAQEGFLDGWIDQSWAGACDELGQRPRSFETSDPLLGYTYHLVNILLHGAILADTPTRHYVVVETFDAWETWEVIHRVPEKLKWEIWAYTHAAIKTPKGLKFPTGTYISWGNRGPDLLTVEDVSFLTNNIDRAELDALNCEQVFGPTIVYNRSALSWQSENHPDQLIKELIDEQAGTVVKWGVPILSATRLEYVDQVKSDLFIFQTPVHINLSDKKHIEKIFQLGIPIAVWGSLAGGIDPELAALAEAQVKKTQVPSGQTIILNERNKRKILLWDPPDEVLTHPYPHIYPYIFIAQLLHYLLRSTNKLSLDTTPVDNPVAISCWKNKDGQIVVLSGNLESASRLGDSNFPKEVEISIPRSLLPAISFPADHMEYFLQDDSGDRTPIAMKNAIFLSAKIRLSANEAKIFTVLNQASNP